MEKLARTLRSIDRKPFKLYKKLQSAVYQFANHELEFDHVQGDPFSTPSRVSLRVRETCAAFPPELWNNRSRQTGMEDFLARRLATLCRKISKGNRGSGNSGKIYIDTSKQQILQRNAVVISKQGIEARLLVGLPAAGRTVLAGEALIMLLEELPKIVEQGLLAASTDLPRLREHIDSNEDQDYLRNWLEDQNLVAFLADGACLPRASGVDDRPLGKAALTLQAPDTLRHTLDLPHGGSISGLGIPGGVTLIVGGGFHGKSTLLHAIERGVYNHIPGDGRERVVTRADAVKIRAEDGRSINRVNISPFIDHLPFGKDTRQFSSDNASGSTSQAANIMEALECGARSLLIDEDTSATNFMIRDERMQTLVSQDKEPITPLLHRVRDLYEKHGISSVIVMGGSGDYLDVADTVIMMDAYQVLDASSRARQLRRPLKVSAAVLHDLQPGTRNIDRQQVSARRGRHDVKIDVYDTRILQYGEHRIELERVEQLVDPGQSRCIGLIMNYYAQTMHQPGESTVSAIRRILTMLEEQGLDAVALRKAGNLALPRLYEIMAALNRIRQSA